MKKKGKKIEIKIKTQKNKNKNKKFKTPRIFFNLTLSLPLTFRVSLFLPHSLLYSSNWRGTDRCGGFG